MIWKHENDFRLPSPRRKRLVLMFPTNIEATPPPRVASYISSFLHMLHDIDLKPPLKLWCFATICRFQACLKIKLWRACAIPLGVIWKSFQSGRMPQETPPPPISPYSLILSFSHRLITSTQAKIPLPIAINQLIRTKAYRFRRMQ